MQVLTKRPRAERLRVRDVVEMAEEGRLRIPAFQRRLCWGPSNRQLLFESILAGYPIGTVLLWKRDAPAGRLVLGPIVRDVKGRPDALWVVDGQQRLTTLAACLLLRPDDPGYSEYALFFDLQENKVVGHSRARVAGPRWLPLHRALHQPDLSQWIVEQGLTSDRERSLRAFEVGDAIRDFELPAVVVETDNEAVLRQIFERTNAAGKRLRGADIFSALHVGLGGDRPDSMSALVYELSQLGYGLIEEKQIIYAALAIAGDDPLKPIRAGTQQPGDQADIVSKATVPLRKAMTFLVEDAEIPAIELVPYALILPILATLFSRFKLEDERNRLLLVRWVWRAILTGWLRGEVRAVRRTLEAARGTDETASIQDLLRLTPRARPAEPVSAREDLNATKAATRVALIAMFSLRPAHLERLLHDAEIIRVSPTDLIPESPSEPESPAEASQVGSTIAPQLADDFAGVLKDLPGVIARRGRGRQAPLALAIGNRLLTPLPLNLDAAACLRAVAELNPDALQSHGFDRAACELILAGADPQAWMELRVQTLEAEIRGFTERMAQWDSDDRPSILSLLDAPPPKDGESE